MVDVSSDKLILAMRQWLVREGQAGSGAFSAWVERVSGIRAFEYPEITGYALTHLAFTPNQSDLELNSGHRAARWLELRVASNNFAARDGWDGDAVYNFDLAMMANGLLQFGSRCGRESAIRTGIQIAHRLKEQTLRSGELAPLPIGADSRRSAWSTDGRALMVKSVQCLLSAAEVDESGDFLEAASQVVNMSERIQMENGRIVTHPSDVETMCHPHLYAVEGLWAHGQASESAESLDRARAGTAWVWAHQLSNGGFPRFVANGPACDPAPEQFDVTAQAVRAGMLTGVVDRDRMSAAIRRLQEVCLIQDDMAAMPYNLEVSHLNVWVTLFARQALSVADGLAKNDVATLQWQSLV